MKHYTFYQTNDFGMALSLTLSAQNEKEAKNLIFDFILKNTTSPLEEFENAVIFLKSAVFEEIGYLSQKSYEIKKQRMEEKDTRIRGEYFSFNDFLENDDIFNLYGEEESKKTYIWFFLNKEYELKEINQDSGIKSYHFIYEGR